jgi:hypothetical protein
VDEIIGIAHDGKIKKEKGKFKKEILTRRVSVFLLLGVAAMKS